MRWDRMEGGIGKGDNMLCAGEYLSFVICFRELIGNGVGLAPGVFLLRCRRCGCGCWDVDEELCSSFLSFSVHMRVFDASDQTMPTTATIFMFPNFHGRCA